MHVVAVLVTPMAPVLELSITHEVFGIARPELADPWYELRYCAETPGGVRIAGDFSVDARRGLDGLDTADTVIVPACGDTGLEPSASVVAALQRAHDRGARIAAICSGAFILGAARLLDGRRATTHWLHAASLAKRFPSVQVDPSVLYSEDDGIFTSAGTAAGLDLCLELVRQDHGVAVANGLARRLVVPPHRAGGQAQYVEAPLAGSENGLSALLDWARTHLDETLGLRELAAAGNTSPRTLARRFQSGVGMSPISWLRRQRIARAQELLETTDEPIERVAELVGFGHAATFRHHFVAVTGVSPSSYRRTFGAGRRAGAMPVRSPRC
jgi:AraC family transcriptional regulator, transcriptional activator FtrA